MALVLGTNSGFVSVAPTADPAAQTILIDGYSSVTKHTSPAGATTITEIGWWCDNATEEANFEVALYAADGGVVPGEAGTRLYHSATNAKGTTSGWKVVSGLNWAISENTVYWIGLQVDDTSTTTETNFAPTSGVGLDDLGPIASLPNPYGGGALTDPDAMEARYAVYTTDAAGGGNINPIYLRSLN